VVEPMDPCADRIIDALIVSLLALISLPRMERSSEEEGSGH